MVPNGCKTIPPACYHGYSIASSDATFSHEALERLFVRHMSEAPGPNGSGLLARLQACALDPGSLPSLGSDELMRDSYKCLTRLQDDASNTDGVHWFCSRATLIVKEAATFLIRLHAYNSPHVPVWKKMCSDVIHSCCDCSYAYQCAKFVCRTS